VIPKIRVWVGRIGAKVERPATLAFWTLVLLMGLAAAVYGSRGAVKADAVLVQATDWAPTHISQLPPCAPAPVKPGTIKELPPAEQAPTPDYKAIAAAKAVADLRHGYVALIWCGVTLMFLGIAQISRPQP
jgi:hypothetical protein